MVILEKIHRKVGKLLGRSSFTNSADYWERRYLDGGTSGSGSYNRLAEFKAQFLNEFVRKKDVRTVIEFGSGDGSQLALANYPNYVGVDVSKAAVKIAREKFRSDNRIKILHTSEFDEQSRADMVISLDVIFHLVEDEIYHYYMKRLFGAAEKWVVIYSSDYEAVTDDPHVRHRNFSRWINDNRPDFDLYEKVLNKYPYSSDDVDNTSFADFFVFQRRHLLNGI